MKSNLRKLIAAVMAMAMLLCLTACDSSDYKEATELYEEGSYEEAEAIFLELGDYEDSAEMALACRYAIAVELMEDEELEEAAEIFQQLGDYEDSEELAQECLYQLAVMAMDEGDFDKAIELFTEVGDYLDAQAYVQHMPCFALTSYLLENGEQSYTDTETDHKVTVSADDRDTFVLNYRIEGSGNGFSMYQDVTLVFDIGSTVADVTGEGNLTVMTAYMQDYGECQLDLSQYKIGDAADWATYNIEGKKVDGTALDPGATGMLMMGSNNASLERIVEGTGIILADLVTQGNIPEMTVVDLGFVNCG